MTSGPDLLLFAVLPYAAALLFVAGTAERYLRHGSTITSMSSQLLENRLHFWGMLPFHAGILVVLLGHVLALLLPGTLLAWNAAPLRLYILEAAGFAGGLLALGGFLVLAYRRVTVRPVRASTHWIDWIVYAVFVAQLASGVAVAMLYPWGSSWYASAAVPYLRSLMLLEPDIALAAAMPLLAKAHIVGTWVLLALFPYSRLVHIVVVPNPYLWRRPQVVRWDRRASLVPGRKS